MIQPLLLGAAAVLAIALYLAATRGERCASVTVNSLACVECHWPTRTVITCEVAP